jgi:TrmH family RNA methyltransferase
MKSWKDKVHFILVEPAESGNIGASARAIKNMGFANLALVNPPGKLTEEADRFAHNAMDVLKSAKNHPTLRDALAGMSLVIGTSRMKGKRRGMVLPVDEVAEKVLSAAYGSGKVALLFGREQRGLSPAEIDECAWMIHIPTDSGQPSLNLAQAVMVVAYELGKEQESASLAEESPLSTHAEQAVLFERFSSPSSTPSAVRPSRGTNSTPSPASAREWRKDSRNRGHGPHPHIPHSFQMLI